MNKKMEIEKNRRKFHTPGCSNYCFRAKNAVFISSGNRLNHEICKALICYQIRKWGDPKLNDRIISLLKELEKETNDLFKGAVKQHNNFITECVPNKDITRRIDILRLEDLQRFEIENKDIDKKDCINFYLR